MRTQNASTCRKRPGYKKVSRRMRAKTTPQVPLPKSEAVDRAIAAIGPLPPPPTPAPRQPTREDDSAQAEQHEDERAGYQRRWRKDKRWKGAGGYWEWKKTKNGPAQAPVGSIKEQRASSSGDSGILPTPPAAVATDGPARSPASKFHPQVPEVPLPKATGRGDPEAQYQDLRESDGVVHDGELPNREEEMATEEGKKE